MSLKSSNQVDTNRCELVITVAADEFENAIEKVFKRESKKITLPGFRKGKAPRAFIEKYYGEQVFYEDAINMVYPSALEEAVKEAGIRMIEDRVDFDLLESGKGKDLVFKVVVTTYPEVSIEGYRGIEVTKKSAEVTDDDVDAELARVQDRNSRMVTVEDRAAENGDTVEIDFEGFVDGEAFEGGKAENFNLELGSGQFIPGFEDQIVGHNTGDEFDVNVTFPEDYHVAELKAKPAVFKIKLHEIKAKELPEIDDDFIKDISEFDTVADYRADVKSKLETSREKQAADDVDNQLINALIEKLQGEIPEAMYQNRITQDIREFDYRLHSQGLDLRTYIQYTGMNEAALRASFKPQAERQVKLRLALEKIAELDGIVPTEEEIEAEYSKLAEAYKMEVEQVKNIIPTEDLSKDIAVEKAMGIVRDNAVVKAEEEAPAEAAEEEKSEEA
ncbi:MAG TPA: trigger factor [Firmicutes bacterium]|nr:trigger factor [Bacillota bacterium]